MNPETICVPGPRQPSLRTDVPAAAADTMIIVVENGVVADILPVGPVEAVIVDLDLIENEDSLEQRVRKAVLPIVSESTITSTDVTRIVIDLVREYRRPERGRRTSASGRDPA
jgi:hypothetical protein